MNSVDIQKMANNCPIVKISAVRETGLSRLRSAIRDLAIHEGTISAEAVFVTRVRHKVALESARESLQYALKTAQAEMPPELMAVDLRGGLKSLGEIVGETASEEILEQIFSRFCVGK